MNNPLLVKEKTHSGTTLIPIESTLFNERKIWIEGIIDHDSAMDFVEELLVLSVADATKPVTVLINSCGGDIEAGLIIYDAITTSKTPIRTIAVGRAHSMAGLLLACADERLLFNHSSVLIHEPLIEDYLKGSASSIKDLSNSLLETKMKLNLLLSKHTGKTLKEVTEATSYDHYMTPQEAIDFGLADRIIPFSEI